MESLDRTTWVVVLGYLKVVYDPDGVGRTWRLVWGRWWRFSPVPLRLRWLPLTG